MTAHRAGQRVTRKGDAVTRAQIGLLGRVGYSRDGDRCPGRASERAHGGIGAIFEGDDPVEKDGAVFIRVTEATRHGTGRQDRVFGIIGIARHVGYGDVARPDRLPLS